MTFKNAGNQCRAVTDFDTSGEVRRNHPAGKDFWRFSVTLLMSRRTGRHEPFERFNQCGGCRSPLKRPWLRN